MSLTQSIDYAAISPPLVVVVTAVAVLLADLFVSAEVRRRLLAPLALAGTLGALGATAWLATGPARSTFCLAGGGCSYVADGFATYFQTIVLAALVVVLLLSYPLFDERERVPPGQVPAAEFLALMLMSVSGMLVVAAGRDLLTLLIGLEVVSLPAFVLVGLRRGDPRGVEAALKFFVFSVVSTALTIYGIALVYGTTGSIELHHIAHALSTRHAHSGAMSATAAAGVVLVLVGFGFKIAAVPFHFWAPDTYQGAPVPVAAFLSVASKAAGFAGLIVLLVVGFRPYADVWGPAVGVLAAVSMTVGNLVALRQRNVVRLLAWSTVAHAGYLLMPLAVASSQLREGVRATLAYLGIYAAMNLGAFGCAVLVRRLHPRLAIEDLRGLVTRAPLTAVAFGLFLTALAGLPPGVAGLFAKVVVFRAAVHGHVTWLAVVAAVNTVIGLAYYLRVAALMFVPADDAPVAPSSRTWSVSAGVAIAAAVTVVLSVYPQPLLHLASTAAQR
ncbi:MAG: NADH-quinone oxidoreductase subunit [Frankiaceae bacterium]|jgi:NADH-quinone oxidoreductase subunit N|nr:NADH-quinone oxidoreductase subunit [Frankiaceae bacterium]